MFKIKSVMSSFLHKYTLVEVPLTLVAVVWLLISGSWLIALIGIAAMFFGSNIIALLLYPMAYFVAHAIKHTTWHSGWKNYILWIFVSIYMTLLTALWGYCVFKLIVIPGKISIPSVVLGYVVATKLFISLTKHDLRTGNYNACCFMFFAQAAFISSLVLIITTHKTNEPIILSYLIGGAMAVIAFAVIWPMRKDYIGSDEAKEFLDIFLK